MTLRTELTKLMMELKKHDQAHVNCAEMADALFNILDDAEAEDVIEDLALDTEAGA